jgi:tetratricopeptide (TPR) repeat protein
MYWADSYPIDRRPELEEALSIGRELDDAWNTATALRNLGLLENIQGNYSQARTCLEQSLAIWRQIGDAGTTGIAWTLIFLADAALNHNEIDWARSLYEESTTMLRQVGDLNFLGYSIRRLAHLLWREGEHEEAFALCRESLKLNHQLSDLRGVIACLAGFAAIAVARNEFSRAANLMAAVETLAATIGIRLLYIDKMEYERNLALLKDKLDGKTLAQFWSQGKTMRLEQAISFALESQASR